jgi:hypothetical protein
MSVAFMPPVRARIIKLSRQNSNPAAAIDSMAFLCTFKKEKGPGWTR